VKKKVKKGMRKMSVSISSSKKNIITGYTPEIKKKVSKIKKLYGEKYESEERYKNNGEKFEVEKEKLVSDLKNLREKNKLEGENITKLIGYVTRKK
jgi:DNA integrity scanning protein DisA with diadenylate cyclase activity